ncbi:MAG: hypothetical protein HOQ11_04165 [Gemmatimonadaceae bacterium]|nr:hypothetical protein [Gemmatimonadaceae bacterium]NUQ92031.1 hypothetical protein [Gemmatimonadaceae bacterium]NUR19125.1 hypothetical protein [Gemmatimonadaceae bacterium]NUS96585.1 hypothetical protein [Gemmatimonadaceae bacterium]
MRPSAHTAVLLALAVAAPVGAQRVPGRDLLDLPLGTLADAPTLAASDVVLWNPAMIMVPAPHLGRVGFAAVQTPPDLGASAVGIMVSGALPRDLAAALSVVRAGVTGLARTESTPETALGDIPYNTTMASLALARRNERVTVGLAVRFRQGTVDVERRGAVGIDGGVLGDSLFGLPIRGAMSTFLWRPANGDDEETAYSGALDGTVYRLDSLVEVRTGYSLLMVERRTTEHYAFVGATGRRWEARIGLARHESSGESEWFLRLGTGLQYGRYHIGVAREGGRDELGGIYQFTLGTLIR